MVLDWFRSGYAELQDMAATYKVQLEILRQYRDLLSIEFIDVDGDVLQTAAEPALKELCGQLDLPWEDDIGSRLNAIAPKVIDGRGSWENYSSTLAAPMQLFGQG